MESSFTHLQLLLQYFPWVAGGGGVGGVSPEAAGHEAGAEQTEKETAALGRAVEFRQGLFRGAEVDWVVGWQGWCRGEGGGEPQAGGAVTAGGAGGFDEVLLQRGIQAGGGEQHVDNGLLACQVGFAAIGKGIGELRGHAAGIGRGGAGNLVQAEGLLAHGELPFPGGFAFVEVFHGFGKGAIPGQGGILHFAFAVCCEPAEAGAFGGIPAIGDGAEGVEGFYLVVLAAFAFDAYAFSHGHEGAGGYIIGHIAAGAEFPEGDDALPGGDEPAHAAQHSLGIRLGGEDAVAGFY